MINYFEELQQTLSRLDPSPLLAFVQACQGTLWLAGNGGKSARAGAGQQPGGADRLGE
jgi:hypothetical protein